MDSNDLERERGITILAKNTGVRYHDVKINIVDTPGHSDFGGEVERALKMVDGVMLLVDASEGPLPQTRYVLTKALEAKLPPIVVINKIDRPDARVAGSARTRFTICSSIWTRTKTSSISRCSTPTPRSASRRPTLEDGGDRICSRCSKRSSNTFPRPAGDPDSDLCRCWWRTSITATTSAAWRSAASSTARFKHGDDVAIAKLDGSLQKTRITKLYSFAGLKRVDETIGQPGDIVAIAGVEGITIGETDHQRRNSRAAAAYRRSTSRRSR